MARSHRTVHNCLPVLHGEDLEDGDEGDFEAFKVPARQFFVYTEVVPTLEDLTTKQGVNENEDEHEDSDPDEIHESTLDDTYDHSHRLE